MLTVGPGAAPLCLRPESRGGAVGAGPSSEEDVQDDVDIDELLPETREFLDVVGDSVRLRKAPGTAGRSAGVVARMKGRSRSRLTTPQTDQILALTRG